MSSIPFIAGSLWGVHPEHRRAEAQRSASAGLGAFHWDRSDGFLGPAGGFSPAEAEEIGADLAHHHEAHLMVADPASEVGAWATLCHRIVVHIESPGWREALQEAARLGCRPAVAVNPGTPLDLVPRDIADVLVMSIVAGHAGAPFDNRAIKRAATLRARGCHGSIGWDGGVTLERFSEAAAVGTDWLVSGGALFGAAEIESWLTAARGAYVGRARRQ